MGIGFSTYIEACGIAPSAVVGSLGCHGPDFYEAANIRVFTLPVSVTLFTLEAHSHGQGHETTFAQLDCRFDLGIPLENVECNRSRRYRKMSPLEWELTVLEVWQLAEARL